MQIYLLLLLSHAFAQFSVSGFELVYSHPIETTLENADLRAPEDVWCEMFDGAKKNIDLAQMYIATDSADDRLHRVITCLENAGKRGVKIRFVIEKAMMRASNAEGIARIEAIPNLKLKVIDWKMINGDGIIHAKYLVVDKRVAFVGSQNFDWRALKHIHETGVKIDDADIVEQMQSIFDQDWRAWRRVNRDNPWKDILGTPRPRQGTRPLAKSQQRAYLVASPWAWNPKGVGDSEAEIVRLMDGAKERIQAVVMDYKPVGFNGKYYPVIDNALRAAAVRGVKVELVLSHWSMDKDAIQHIKSLSLIPNISLKVATLPEAKGGFIPFARVVHSKFMVIDGKTSWVGTSNWAGGYLDNSRNLEVVLNDKNFSERLAKLHSQLSTSIYSEPVDVNKEYPKPRKGI